MAEDVEASSQAMESSINDQFALTDAEQRNPINANMWILLAVGAFVLCYCIPCLIIMKRMKGKAMLSERYLKGKTCWHLFETEYGYGVKIWILAYCLLTGIFAYANIRFVYEKATIIAAISVALCCFSFCFGTSLCCFYLCWFRKTVKQGIVQDKQNVHAPFVGELGDSKSFLVKPHHRHKELTQDKADDPLSRFLTKKHAQDEGNDFASAFDQPSPHGNLPDGDNSRTGAAGLAGLMFAGGTTAGTSPSHEYQSKDFHKLDMVGEQDDEEEEEEAYVPIQERKKRQQYAHEGHKVTHLSEVGGKTLRNIHDMDVAHKHDEARIEQAMRLDTDRQASKLENLKVARHRKLMQEKYHVEAQEPEQQDQHSYKPLSRADFAGRRTFVQASELQQESNKEREQLMSVLHQQEVEAKRKLERIRHQRQQAMEEARATKQHTKHEQNITNLPEQDGKEDLGDAFASSPSTRPRKKKKRKKSSRS